MRHDAPTPIDDDRRVKIDVGLINNMPDSALEQTERQILKLLHAASADLAVRVKLYALTDVPRSEFGRQHLRRMNYFSASTLWNSSLDCLIITGAEPRTANLKDEPYWQELSTALTWAEQNTLSTITSCLAVHAAVLHLDGIGRRSLDDKCFGIFNFETTSNHPFIAGIPQRFVMPHSRWNSIDGADLLNAGYEILAASPADGVDTFVKSRRSLFVFFQGHPEYEAWTLLGEYRRDIGRFLAGERQTYPAMPEGCFDDGCTSVLQAFKERACGDRRKELMAHFPSDRLSGRLSDPWRPVAVKLYTNWLCWVAARKADHSSSILGLRHLAMPR